tara:strand:+ start:1785 stop:2144 length:360 start_codon:yes stop_codon:yes gene_type:complete
MRIIIFLFFFLGSLNIQANNDKKIIYEKQGELTKVTKFHDNGIVFQTGFLKNNKLHGDWISFNKDGSKKSRGNYVNGKKTGKWLFWNDNKLIEADFKDNKLIKTIEWSTNQIVESSEIK